MKVVGWDGGSLNARFASHKSSPVLCRHVTAASLNNSYRCAVGRSMMFAGNTHMVGSDRQTGWREVGQHTERNDGGKKIMDDCW